MEVFLYVMSLEGKHFVSGMIYTPTGIEQYNNVFDNFDDIFKIRPTFATRIICSYDEYCIKNANKSFYYLTYSNLEDLKRMLTFMEGAPSSYLAYVPSDVIKDLGIVLGMPEIKFSKVNIPQSEQIPCKFIGSIPTYVKLVGDKVYVNGVDVGYSLAEIKEEFKKDLRKPKFDPYYFIRMNLSYILALYTTKQPQFLLTWSTILKMWCGTKIS